MHNLNNKGLTRFEHISIIIILAVLISLLIPASLSFVESQRRSTDYQKALKAQESARSEYMLSHFGKETGSVVYSFSGNTEVLSIVAHEPLGDRAPENLDPPRFDKYADGGANSGGALATGESKTVGDTPLYIVVGEDGQIVYNSWNALILK